MEDTSQQQNGGEHTMADKKAPERTRKLEVQYQIDDTPPWYTCIILGFQHYLTMFGATIVIPFALAPALCSSGDTVGISELISTIFFISGLCTLLQTTFGVRLPIVQGGTFAYLAPAFAILSLEKFKCPAMIDSNTVNETEFFGNSSDPIIIGSPEHREVWQVRMREIQGAILLASLIQLTVGMTGIMGLLLRFIGPLAITPTITLIGLALFEVAANFCSSHWWIALATICLVILFSQYLRNVELPMCSYKKGGFQKTSFPVFKLFPVLLAVLIAWVLCAILTATNALSSDPKAWGYGARTDTKLDVLQQSAWFRFPYPCILLEGIGCICAGLWGTGTGTTSYSENVGAIGITKVGSLRVVQVGGFIMIILGLLGKFGALFATIPEPVVGGILMSMFGMITAVGLSNLQFVDLNSSRNLFIVGFAILFGLSLPQWITKHPGRIQTGNEVVDQLFTVLLTTSMFVGGVIGFILDNTIPGTIEERGIKKWRRELASDGSELSADLGCYEISLFSKLIRRMKWTRFIPICPTFLMGKTKKTENSDSEEKTQTTEVQIPIDNTTKL
eukprot:GHVU01070027.1.p1 GENE.GHVU01070027.1~~GHVU01070027.1.p1  ORF type:complete len:562 (+),score=14.78 GHVU01070027.1:91-1776(+)